MKEYTITAKVTISIQTKVEANDEKEALELAKQRPTAQIMLDSFYTPDLFWIAEELDGEPFDLEIEAR